MEVRQAGKVHGCCLLFVFLNTLDVAVLGRGGIIAVYVRGRDFQNEGGACEISSTVQQDCFGYT